MPLHAALNARPTKAAVAHMHSVNPTGAANAGLRIITHFGSVHTSPVHVLMQACTMSSSSQSSVSSTVREIIVHSEQAGTYPPTLDGGQHFSVEDTKVIGLPLRHGVQHCQACRHQLQAKHLFEHQTRMQVAPHECLVSGSIVRQFRGPIQGACAARPYLAVM